MPDRTLVFHVGMPKTGSTSIQETLYYGLEDRQFHYIGFGQISGSRAMRILFSDSAGDSRLSKALGFDSRSLGQMRKMLMHRLLKSLAICDRRHATPIVSAEWCWRMTREEYVGVLEFFAARGYRVEPIAYVRSLWGWYPSAFQENVKWGDADFTPCRGVFDDRPQVRSEGDLIATLEVLEGVFGGKYLRVIPFVRSSLASGCVVEDFCRMLGIGMSPRRIRRANDGLGVDAIRAIYASNALGAGYGHGPRAVEKNVLLQRRLTGMGGPPFRYHSTLLETWTDEIARQHAGVAERTGAAFPNHPSSADDADAIRKEADLFRYSVESVGWLEKASGLPIRTPGGDDAPPAHVAAAVDSLRERQPVWARARRVGEFVMRELRRMSHGV
ncbi:MAG: hypothetical protein RLZZ326_435 [Planctomycetota bacterium]|jgi:hypothetical protein